MNFHSIFLEHLIGFSSEPQKRLDFPPTYFTYQYVYRGGGGKWAHSFLFAPTTNDEILYLGETHFLISDRNVCIFSITFLPQFWFFSFLVSLSWSFSPNSAFVFSRNLKSKLVQTLLLWTLKQCKILALSYY